MKLGELGSTATGVGGVDVCTWKAKMREIIAYYMNKLLLLLYNIFFFIVYNRSLFPLSIKASVTFWHF